MNPSTTATAASVRAVRLSDTNVTPMELDPEPSDKPDTALATYPADAGPG